MIILKAVHEARLAAKDAEIALLKEENAWLRNFVQPAPTKASRIVSLEADLVLEGRQDAIEAPAPATEELTAEDQAILRERDRILSGTY